ncbi:MAG: hypothetical protein R3B41_00635 [Candidatus Doudnabacteria bacterium]
MINISILDIFLIIASSAIIIVSILSIIGLIYLILFLRTIKQVANSAKRATEIVSTDIASLRDNIKKNGLSLSALAGFAKAIKKKKSKTK